MTETKVFTLEDLKKHTTQDDCWLLLFGKIYDATKFLDDHPGGSELLLDVTGRDATEDFEDVFHSSTARKQLDGLYIGELNEDDKAKIKTVAAAKPAAVAKKAPAKVNPMVTFIKAILPFLIGVIAFLYSKSR